jgi:FkbM family methyltransferase
MKKFVSRLIEETLERAGYSLRPHWRMESWQLARHLSDLFRTFDVDCVIDVGAHEGAYGAFLRREVGYRGLIVSFEPTSTSFARLHARASDDPLWMVNQLALGSTRGDMVMRVTQDSKFSSFLAASESHADDFVQSNTTVKEETVQITTVDMFMEGFRKKHGVSRLYLKIDTQGFDLEVLKGAAETLSGIVALQSEMSVLPIYEGMPTHEEAKTEIARRGYELSGMFPVSVDRRHRLVEYDCIFVRSSIV